MAQGDIMVPLLTSSSSLLDNTENTPSFPIVLSPLLQIYDECNNNLIEVEYVFPIVLTIDLGKKASIIIREIPLPSETRFQNCYLKPPIHIVAGESWMETIVSILSFLIYHWMHRREKPKRPNILTETSGSK